MISVDEFKTRMARAQVQDHARREAAEQQTRELKAMCALAGFTVEQEHYTPNALTVRDNGGAAIQGTVADLHARLIA